MGAKNPKPRNCFLLYCKEERSKLAQQYPHKNNSEITSELGKQWRSMPPSRKKQYQMIAAASAKKFKKENPNYTPPIKIENQFITSFKVTPKKSIEKDRKPEPTIKKTSNNNNNCLPSFNQLLQRISLMESGIIPPL